MTTQDAPRDETPHKSNGKLATVLAVASTVIAIISFGFSCYTFDAQQDDQAREKSVEMFEKYLALTAEHPQYVEPAASVLASPQYRQFAYYALFTGETVLGWAPDDHGWRLTVRLIIKDHEQFICREQAVGEQYSRDFRLLVDSVVSCR